MEILRKYKIVDASDAEDLEESVNDLIEKGWVPQGGLTISDTDWFMQSMCLYDTKE